MKYICKLYAQKYKKNLVEKLNINNNNSKNRDYYAERHEKEKLLLITFAEMKVQV